MKTKSFLFTASVALAMALTFSCSEDKDDNILKRQGADRYFVDKRDGKKYAYVTIGMQTWMAENLNYAEQDSNSWYAKKGSKCGVVFTEPDSLEYAAEVTSVCSSMGMHNGPCTVSGVLSNDDTPTCNTYGRLYSWEFIMEGTKLRDESAPIDITYHGVQGICPAGWHLPTMAEWDVLISYMENDDYGFNALLGGTGTGSNGFSDLGIKGTFYTATAYHGSFPHTIVIEGNGWNRSYSSPELLQSVRCVKDNDNICETTLFDAASGNFRCENGIVETKCGENWYNQLDPTLRCENNVIETKCGNDDWYDYSAKKEYCSNGIKKTYGSITDKNGQTYRTVEIGTQTWMAEDMKNPDRDTYVYMYIWTEAMDIVGEASQIQPENHQGVCPEGWHIPSMADWNVLLEYVGGASIAGKHLKSADGWSLSGLSSGEDTYGFAALPGPVGEIQGSWWSTEYASTSPLYMYYELNAVSFQSWISNASVRCLKN